jgi:hypothetical protein
MYLRQVRAEISCREIWMGPEEWDQNHCSGGVVGGGGAELRSADSRGRLSPHELSLGLESEECPPRSSGGHFALIILIK